MAKIHPTAFVDPTAELGENVVIGPHCAVEYCAKIGDQTVLQYGAIVHRWTELGCNNTLLPGAILGGDPQHFSYRGEETWLRIGDGNYFGEYVTVHRGSESGSETVIGNRNYFMAYSHVGHDCRLGDSIVLTNHAGVGGHCDIQDNALLGGYSGAHQFVRVGRMAMLSGGSLCGQDVIPYVIVQGAPAQPRGLNIVGMQRNGVSAEAREALHQVYKLLFLHRLTLPDAVEKIRNEVKMLPEIEYVLEFIAQSKRGIARRKASE